MTTVETNMIGYGKLASWNMLIGFHAFVSDRLEEIGAIRAVSPDGRNLTVYVENAGEFVVPSDAVTSVQAQKVVFDPAKLDLPLRRAIGHAHDAERL